jgi:4'-phosphopantetheinyl transferase EntD
MNDGNVVAWESFFRRALGLPVSIAMSSEGDEPQELTAAERAICDGLGSPHRREIWLRGRGALKAVLHRLGEDADTATIAFPHPRFSISHCAGSAVAVGLGAGSRVHGIGVDLELERTPPENSTRFFLTPEESAWLDATALPERRATLQRLWTAKEAVFKADPGNAERLLTDYRLVDLFQNAGRALGNGNEFSYASLVIPGGTLSVAILGGREFTEETRA